ncbi:hypothetical protein L1987_25114 [Smallanthus sonchifolius]|uniref:Uncharacterized protein n=1 Tax=Smallanthus sonchifolius TaxID=185202 RepID=A0ACB9IMC6_9ASTR|nr:hypothetical protein L1987_25114 [Smallanthus sonchifolius]
MPTPVNIARQCLSPEAIQILDEAVSVAHRRCHAQTSSLHAVSALLSPPSSPLREACGPARNSAYSSRIQSKALELCLGAALDRLPSTPKRLEEPPVSNSLMAAIKRSQANQRRQPENFHLYQQTAACSPSSASVSTVKVELQNLIMSILDDPVVSRVFGESGFRSSDIKLSILRPVHPIRLAMAETFPKSSLMDSFVPFGGFFSMPSDIKSPLRIRNHFGSLCHICAVKFKEEVNAISKGELNGSVSDHYRSTLPSWLQSSQICANHEVDAVKAQDDPVVASVKIIGLQKKWNNICQRLHQGEPYFQMLPKTTSVVDFQVSERANQIAGSSIENECDTISKSNSKNSIDLTTVCSLSGSTASGNSVTTDLGLSPFNQKDSKLVYSSLLTRVGRQEEVLGVISQTIARCRAQSGPNRGGIWFGLVGPDRAAKTKTAVALAEVLFGGRENMICVDLSCQDFINGCDLKLRGKNIIDFIADELIRKQLSVVFLENVDRADMLTQHHLSRATSTGRFSDSHGREVSICNAVFVLTSKFFGENELEGIVDYTEENVLKAKCGPIRLLTGFDLGGVNPSGKMVHVTRNQQNKRKHYLDLNLPAEESGTDYDSAPENPNGWLEGLLEHVDEKVIFKPFDFDSLAENILKRIGDCFENNVGLDCWLEIDYKVMEQILKASCFLETLKTEDWIEQALGEAFTEAKKKYGFGSHSVLKLITEELPEEQLFGIRLPGRIIMT